MISSIGQNTATTNVWQKYSDTTTTSTQDTEDVKKPKGNRPPPPPPKNGGTKGKGNVEATDSSQVLTTAQKDSVKSILGEYDSSSLTTENANSIIKAFENAGITESSSLADTISDNGFDAEKIKSLSSSTGTVSSNSIQSREMMAKFTNMDSSDIKQISTETTSSQNDKNLISLLNKYKENQNYSNNSQTYNENSLNLVG